MRSDYDRIDFRALAENTGDLISHWTDGRWRSTRHRVLAPPPLDGFPDLAAWFARVGKRSAVQRGLAVGKALRKS